MLNWGLGGKQSGGWLMWVENGRLWLNQLAHGCGDYGGHETKWLLSWWWLRDDKEKVRCLSRGGDEDGCVRGQLRAPGS